MTTGARDTSSEARRLQDRVHARLGPEARLQMAFELSESVRRIRLEGLLAENPGVTEPELVRRFIQEVHGIRPWWT